MKKLLPTVAAVAGVGAAMLVATGAGSAQAVDAGYFSAIGTTTSINDKSGTNLDVVAVEVSEPCDAAATRHVLKVTSVVPTSGADAAEAAKWAGDNLYAPLGAGLPGPLSVSASNFWQGLADTYGQKLVAGKYNLELRCQNNLGTVIYEQWKGSVTFSSPTAWSADAIPGPSPSPSVSSTPTSTLTASPSPSATPTASPTPSVTPTVSPSTSTSPSPSSSTTPSPTPTSSAGSITILVDGEPVEPGDTLEPGSSLDVTATGFTPGEGVTLTVGPDGQVIGTTTADTTGTVTIEVTLPDDLEAGEHTLTVAGDDSGVEQVLAFAVAADADNAPGALAQTGLEVGAIVGLALALLAGGAVLVVAARRRGLRLH